MANVIVRYTVTVPKEIRVEVPDELIAKVREADAETAKYYNSTISYDAPAFKEARDNWYRVTGDLQDAIDWGAISDSEIDYVDFEGVDDEDGEPLLVW